MRKSIYFIIQIIWSVIFSLIVWYLFLKNATFDFYGNSDNTIAGIVLFVGGVLYLVLTLAQIIIGIKKVKEWRWWIILVSLLIAGASAFLSLYLLPIVLEL
ncbi:MAG: hypothetical protein K6F79_09110 [Saccharofermentans sp.]|nr:hypothetical protein [Saccharofermentans sp.]